MSARNVTQSPPCTRQLLEAWRQARGLTHERFGLFVGRDAPAWSRIRRGLQGITAETMRGVLRQADEPWRTALALAWLRETLGVGVELTVRPPAEEPEGAHPAGA